MAATALSLGGLFWLLWWRWPRRRFTLAPLRASLRFGREVLGLSVADVLASPELQALVRAALDEHGLLLFRGATLSPAEEEAFAKIFDWDDTVPLVALAGPFGGTVQMAGVYGVGGGGAAVQTSGALGSRGVDRWKLPKHPVIQLQGHGQVRGHHGVADGELRSAQPFCEWHTDGVHDTPTGTHPPSVTVMYCLDTPTCGGETLFASGRAGLANLPPPLRARARRTDVVFDGRFRECTVDGTRALPAELAVAPDQE